MTRFARAKGSKASNDRVPESATPWSQMKAELLNKDKEKTENDAREKIFQQRNETYQQFLKEREDEQNKNVVWADFDTDKKQENNKKKKRKIDDSNVEQVPTKKSNKINRNTKDNNNIEKVKISKLKTKSQQSTISPETENNSKEEPAEKSEKDLLKIKKKKNKLSQKDLPQANGEQQLNSTNINKKSFLDQSSENINSKKEQTEISEKDLLKIQKKKDKKLKQIQKKKQFKLTQKDLQHANDEQQLNLINSNEKSFPNRSFKRNENNFSEKGNNRSKTNTNTNKKNKKRDNPNMDYRRRKAACEILYINGKTVDVKYIDGFPVKKEDAERIMKLRREMISKGLPRSEIDFALKLERRKAEKALAREKKNVCFNCRKSGHMLSECPELNKNQIAESAGTGICFKCGSTEHTHFECKVERGDNYKFAQCFICNQQGHIARQCPDNQRGMYPKGGSCKVCGDVTHLKKDCPKYQAQQSQLQSNLSISTINADNPDVIESNRNQNNNNSFNKRPNKIIKF